MPPGTENVSLFLAFAAGLLSFLSPCVLPLIPSYISLISGVSLEQLTERDNPGRWRGHTFTHALLFVLGFSLVFISMGASATALGGLLASNQRLIAKVGGIIIILLGFHLTGLVNFAFLNRDKRWHLKTRPVGLVGSGLVGITFAAGWTPCIGPILGTILVYAGTAQNVTAGIYLLSIYSLGLGLPFLLTSLAVPKFLGLFKRFRKHLRIVSVASGAFLIFAGILIYFNYLGLLTGYLAAWLLPIFPFLAL